MKSFNPVSNPYLNSMTVKYTPKMKQIISFNWKLRDECKQSVPNLFVKSTPTYSLSMMNVSKNPKNGMKTRYFRVGW